MAGLTRLLFPPTRFLQLARTSAIHGRWTPQLFRSCSTEAAPPAVTASAKRAEAAEQAEENKSMLPRDVVKQLDKFIIGQEPAKRAVSIAFRNRWRRHRIPEEMKEEVIPKNILMIGPTGCGKTEIARRLAKMTQSPFIKVEATKFTEVGFHGKDVDQIIRDLVDIAVLQTRTKAKDKLRAKVRESVENKLLVLLNGIDQRQATQDTFRDLLREGKLDDREVEVEVIDQHALKRGVGHLPQQIGDIVLSMETMMGKPKKHVKKMKVKEAIPQIEDMELDKLVTEESVVREAIKAVEDDGIVFIDEIDKIVAGQGQRGTNHPTASDEGVQKDLLPLIEGTTITTRYGNVDTTRILFIASGAFSSCKPADMLAELQGRLPIRVELKALTEEDLYRILTEPKSSLVKQQVQLLATEGVKVNFTDDGIREIAHIAADVNTNLENIGARRLHTVMERIIEDVSYNCDTYADKEVVVDKAHVLKHLGDLINKKSDLSKFIL